MQNYHVHLKDIPRRLKRSPKLSGIVSFVDATGTWSGRRPGNIEFAIRLKSNDPCSNEVQNGIHYEMKFPHVFIKKPNSEFYTKPFAPRRAFVLIYEEQETAALLTSGFSLSNVSWPLVVTDECESLIEKMEQLCENLFHPGTADRLDALALCMLTELFLQCPEDQNKSAESLYESKIRQAAS